jgi:diguanylate cyclase (GGDEF)-like protein/PAS domain S-box-containing protein
MEMSRSRGQRAIDSRGASLSKAVGSLLLLGAGFVAITVNLPHPSGGSIAVQLAIGGAMLVAGVLCWLLASRFPAQLAHVLLFAAAAAAAGLIVASGVAAGGYGSIFVWVVLVAGVFFPRRIALVHLGWIFIVNAVALIAVESTAGYSPLTRWLSTAISLTVVTLLTTEIVQRRGRADMRARRFFDLSQDLLSTMDLSGRCVEVNPAWTECLGYTAAEMQGRPLLDITHPDDLAVATRRVRAVFRGEAAAGLETRVRAKDGSWHWLRSTATYAEDEELVYARSTDVTELKRIEGEREELLVKIEQLAHSDSLTGLPNRRALEERLPLDMARARRARSSLCLALIDVDRFKSYNDAHGHLAGDALLRGCAAAWDQELRAEDSLCRFGGEEFVAVMPECSLDQGGAIVERLRAATPQGQTVSAGIALWDLKEPPDSLIDRADAALYQAKESGRDQLVEARVDQLRA